MSANLPKRDFTRDPVAILVDRQKLTCVGCRHAEHHEQFQIRVTVCHFRVTTRWFRGDGKQCDRYLAKDSR